MKQNLFRLLGSSLLLAISLAATACGPDFYLSESEAAAYTNLFHRETDANNFISTSLPGQTLQVDFDNTSQPPAIHSTNLVTLMRNYTTLGWNESFNHQVQLDRLNAELQTQMERWIRNELQLYTGTGNAAASLSQLSSIQVRFLNQPTFTFHPERQAIAFSLNVRLTIYATVDVHALDYVSNLIFGVNGRYPIAIQIDNLTLNGEARFLSTYADASRILFTVTPQPGAVSVSNSGTSTAPKTVITGVANTVRQQLSQPLSQSFTQQYSYFQVTGLGLTPVTTQTPSTLTYSYQSRPEVAKPMLHIVGRGADGRLYHLRKTEGGQSVIGPVQTFPALQTSIQNEPALFASAADQLELAATDTSGNLVYAHWRDETWINQTTFAPGSSTGYIGKPVVIASAPGQVEIIALGRNGGLWHLRRRNGVWASPVQVQLASLGHFVSAPVRDPVATLTGTKVCLFFVDGQNHLWAILFDLESGFWGAPQYLPTAESINYAPAAAASGDGHVDVVYVGQSSTPYQIGLDTQIGNFPQASYTTGINNYSAETNIGGSVTATPALVCSSYQQLEMIARGTDNHLYYNHFLGPSFPTTVVDGRWLTGGWQGWSDLNGNFSGTLTFESMTGFSAAATRTGKVELAAIRQPWTFDTQADQYIFQNSFDSERYGSAAWKTVGWRGYEQLGQQRLLGQPALAITDRHAAAAYVDNTFRLQRARLAESNYANFGGVDASTNLLFPPPVDPVVVSSLPGYLDAIVVGTDGLLHHVRSGDRGRFVTATLISPSSVTFSTQPAVVGFGTGQLEVVAVANNNALYHWRYRNGSWYSPTMLGGAAISQPVLTYLGDGQLLLFAIGNDRHLYYWSFTNGLWSNPQSIPTSFLVNPLLFGPLSASSWGDGSVDLVLVDAQTGAVNHGRIGPQYFTSGINLGLTPSRAFMSVGGNVTDTPVLTAFSPTRLHLLATGTDHLLYSNWASFDYAHPAYTTNQAPPIVWSGYSSIGGYQLLPGGIAKTGPNEMTLVGTDTTGRLMLGRYTGAHWTQFQSILGQPVNTQLAAPRYRPAVTTFNN